jgi:hypothetical protein
MNRRMFEKWITVCIFVFGAYCILNAPRAHCADEPPNHVIVIVEMNDCCTEQAYPEAERALSDELRLLNIPVIRKSGAETEEAAQRQELERIADSYNAVAAVRISRPFTSGPADVSLWITNPATKKKVYRKIEIGQSSELSLAMLVAMRTVETLRASLLERHSPNRVSPKAVFPESQRIVDERHFSPLYRLGLGISSGLTMSPGGAGIRAAFGASALVQPVRNLDVTVSANWSPPGGTYQTDGVRSTLTYLLLRGWLHFRLASHSLLRPAFGVGAGAFIGTAKGETEGGTPTKTARTYVSYVGASTRVYIFASERVPFYIDCSAGLLLPEAQIVHGDARAATLGTPLIELRFGLELRFWKI